MPSSAWFMQPEDVEAYELVRDNTSSFSWKRAAAANLACKRHPYTDREGPSCKLETCVICHVYREEAKSKNEVGGWIWSKNDVADHLNGVLPHLCKEALKEPTWTTAMGADCSNARKNAPGALKR